MEKIIVMNMSIDDLNELITKAVTLAINNNNIRIQKQMDVNPKIKGIRELAEALNCSVAKAQQLKNSGTIRYFQDGKLVLFDINQVYEDLQGININKRGRKPAI